MPKVIINDEAFDIGPGERLLDVARRNAAHIGFVCDGNGLCQMCECLVLRGGEQLNPPNEAEEIWLTKMQLEQGRRLACQSSLRGPGPVEILTRAEELRRKTQTVIYPPEGTNRQDHVRILLDSLFIVNVEHIKRFPMNMIYTMVRIFALRPTINSAQQMVVDSWRIFTRMASVGLGNGVHPTIVSSQPGIVETPSSPGREALRRLPPPGQP